MFTTLRTDLGKYLIIELTQETPTSLKLVKVYDFDVFNQSYKETLLVELEAKFDIDKEELKLLYQTFEEADIQIKTLVDKRVNYLISREDEIKAFIKSLKTELNGVKKEQVALCKKRKNS